MRPFPYTPYTCVSLSKAGKIKVPGPDDPDALTWVRVSPSLENFLGKCLDTS